MKSILVYTFLCFSLASFSQHCPFDNAGILVLEVKDAEAGNQIRQNLRICLVDFQGELVCDYKNEEQCFVLNPDSTSKDWYAYNFEKIRYSFAEDNYILPLSMDFQGEGLAIQIVDTSGKYKSQKISISADSFFDLHDNIGNWTEIDELMETPELAEPFVRLIQCKLETY